MNDFQKPQDGSMEDILSSIRKILNEDPPLQKPLEKNELKPPQVPLELTEVVKDKEKTEQVFYAAKDLSPQEKELETFSNVCAEIPLISPSTLSASMAALSSLKEALKPQAHFHGQTTLEEMGKTLLMPLLQEWINQYLPSLVERIVREEVQRITQRFS